jgi:hypothetical protein
MPPGASRAEVNELALALSDVVLAGDHDLVDAASQLRKPIVEPGAVLPPATTTEPASPDKLIALDPQSRRGMAGWTLRGAGRWDWFMNHVLAYWGRLLYGLIGRSPLPSLTPFTKAIGKLVPGRWSNEAYFAPDSWKTHCPIDPATLVASNIVRTFDRLDRAALGGARLYRDLIWTAHFFAAAAVFAAVAGAIRFPPHLSLRLPDLADGPLIELWPAVELFVLVAILLIVHLAYRWRLHQRWIACRIGAEQLRIARLCLPLLVTPRLLLTPDRPEPGHADGEAAAAMSLVKRAIRDDGLCAARQGFGVREAAAWVRCIVDDQAAYHRNNFERLEGVEMGIKAVSTIFFASAIFVVLAHVLHQIEEAPWLLLVTAAGPAFAAATHAAGTRLEIVHRRELSRESAHALQDISARLAVEVDQADEVSAWIAVRQSARQAAQVMGSEAETWHATMLLETLALP